jgi:hypothetical protein
MSYSEMLSELLQSPRDFVQLSFEPKLSFSDAQRILGSFSTTEGLLTTQFLSGVA